jgi:hypothetical protein
MRLDKQRRSTSSFDRLVSQETAVGQGRAFYRINFTEATAR